LLPYHMSSHHSIHGNIVFWLMNVNMIQKSHK
jgi:hypothetical protein